ncbi:DUF3224 domain-containing protein [Kineosporia rhizophila]|uniref:DUF3224 domain-containing protein n=1 Tax=Kineosporia TaxID=49184 RepID=UPI001E3C02AC|nr:MULTISPECIES: DUF3224 domain-containing protein [Kineosporia]MCE0539322.1 DUF3224 domain-containing protein [Kineosporia rhizophila]GLY18527.1 hypothetical protein Kisp01_55410 [Kineosporia sp. NBRC 101677]
MTEIVAEFQVTRWDAEPYAEQDTVLSQVVVEKTFTGAVSGTSTARVLTAQAEGGQGYVASERFEGTIDGRSGTLVYQHGGIMDGEDGTTFGTIVPGSGTGELAGLRGTITLWHDAQGATITLRLS